MNDLERQIELRVAAFRADIEQLLAQASELGSEVESRARPLRSSIGLRRKRTPEELARMSHEFLVYVSENPGQRMEHIARALDYPTHALRREVKKLLRDGKVRMEGQTRASTYFASAPRR